MTGVWHFVRAKFKAELFMWQGIGETNKDLKRKAKNMSGSYLQSVVIFRKGWRKPRF